MKNERPDLIISDDVYGTFVPHYRSLLDDLPYNTACVCGDSFSKYFGATGWRRRHRHGAEERLRRPHREAADDKEAGAREPLCVPDRPHREGEKFTDRMVADSRLVALNGTAGLQHPSGG